MNIFHPAGSTRKNHTNSLTALLGGLGLSLFLVACATQPVTQTSASGETSTATTAAATAPTSTAATTATTVAAAEEKLICRKIEVTGTRFPVEECRTQAQWNRVNRNQRAVADEYGRQSRESSATFAPGESSGPMGY